MYRSSRGPKKAFVKIEEVRLRVEEGRDYTLVVFASVTKDGKAIVGGDLTAYTNHKAWEPVQTDGAGRCLWELTQLKARDVVTGNYILVEVTYTDADGYVSKDSKTVSLSAGTSTKVGEPKVSGPPVATTLEATASSGQLVGGKMRYYITLVARDQFKRTIAAGEVLWNCGPKSGNVDLGTGYATHIVELADPEVEFAYTAHSPSANLALAQPLKLSGPPKPEKTKDEPETLEVTPPYCANADGSFTVKVITKKGGKPHGGVKFTLTAIEPLTATAFNRTMLGKGQSLELTTSPDGTLTFLLTFGNSVQAQVIFSLPSGFSVSVTFVKLP